VAHSSIDSTDHHLAVLSPDIQMAAYYLVLIVRNAGIPLKITSSTRTSSEQASLVRAGRSTTLNSKHLMGQAFDVDIHGWNRDDIPLWWFTQLGQLGEQLGLRWGGRWSGFRDYGHFENPRSFV